jgi:signal transduction histidine kinase
MALNEQPQTGAVRFSHRLVLFHMLGLLMMIALVISSILWISLRHNDLAQNSAERMVRGALVAFQQKMETVVRDYSIWDDVIIALEARDTDWLYNSIGSAAADIGTLDGAFLRDSATGWTVGWVAGSPPQGATDLLPQDIFDAMDALLAGTNPTGHPVATAYVEWQDEVWSLAISRVVPIGDLDPAVDEASYPRQIHGLRMTDERLGGIGATILMDDLHYAGEIEPARDGLPLLDTDRAAIGYVTWTPPEPGARILQQVALPVGGGLLLAVAFALFSSSYSVRSARKLERALEDAQVADRAKTEFLSNVSHELRTPMNGILGVTQLLEMTDLNDEQRELLGVLSGSAETQMSLISDLLEIMQIESGVRPLSREPFEPGTVVSQVADLLRPEAMKKGIAISADLDAGAMDPLIGDSRAVKQIVTNLAGNAVKFTNTGNVRLLLRTEPDAGATLLRIVVEDTGPGIAPEHQALIFERFAQVDSSLRRSADGIGLGLAISKSLAEMMGGRIALVSTPGKGSAFTLTLRLERAPAAARLKGAA